MVETGVELAHVVDDGLPEGMVRAESRGEDVGLVAPSGVVVLAG